MKLFFFIPRYLYDKLIGPRGLTYKISFLSPHVSFDDIQGKDIARVLMKTKVLKDEKIILAPYNVGHSTYSKEKLDEVKEEWATHMIEDVINDAKRLQK
ncbi:unnamed protein product [Trifolium pratense]|uniref:Uncharacterized protein n=1 Tax=Trifolium pratense TaxID=57577 RepID=A0ACB0JM18_TRIPR|nr:unnamed protein product [Trifolium pratense]